MILKNKSLWFVFLAYSLLVAALLVMSLYLNEGHFVLALDDPYIHMSMAKNFVNHGNWATNNMDFTSASSSPLWILLISAVYFIFGVSVSAPFVLNILFQFAAIFIAYRIFKEFDVSKYLFYALMAFALITPLPAILFTGMEHSAQVTFALLFVLLSTRLISGSDDKNRVFRYLLIATPFLTGLRYESMFIVSVVCLLLVFRKKYLFALLLLIFGALPIVIYGFISVSHGWYFLPNPILLKSSLPAVSLMGVLKFFHRAFKNITEPHIFLLLIISVFLFVINYVRQKKFWSRKQVFLMIVILTTIVNMSLIEFHQNGWFYRYDAYLMALGIIAVIIGINDYIPEIKALLNTQKVIVRTAAIVMTVILILPFLLRAVTFMEVPFATNNIYDQHYQMSSFVREYASGINLAANDIGMIDFGTDNGVLDLYGLSNMEVARDKLERRYDTESINKITKEAGIRLAIVYENGYGQYGGLPRNWVKIGEWTMTDYNFVCGYETTTFFSVNSADTDKLRNMLKNYSAKLPGSVVFKIF